MEDKRNNEAQRFLSRWNPAHLAGEFDVAPKIA